MTTHRKGENMMGKKCNWKKMLEIQVSDKWLESIKFF